MRPALLTGMRHNRFFLTAFTQEPSGYIYGYLNLLHQTIQLGDYNLILNPLGGKVGIGTSTPDTKLEIKDKAMTLKCMACGSKHTVR